MQKNSTQNSKNGFRLKVVGNVGTMGALGIGNPNILEDPSLLFREETIDFILNLILLNCS
jgi:hypothetical protein